MSKQLRSSEKGSRLVETTETESVGKNTATAVEEKRIQLFLPIRFVAPGKSFNLTKKDILFECHRGTATAAAAASAAMLLRRTN